MAKLLMAKGKKGQKKRTTIYLEDDLLWRMKELAPKLRISSATKAAEAAVLYWVEQMEAKFGKPDGPKSKPARAS